MKAIEITKVNKHILANIPFFALTSGVLHICLSVNKDIFSVVCYRYDISCFDVEAGQVVVVAVILQSPNLKGC